VLRCSFQKSSTSESRCLLPNWLRLSDGSFAIRKRTFAATNLNDRFGSIPAFEGSRFRHRRTSSSSERCLSPEGRIFLLYLKAHNDRREFRSTFSSEKLTIWSCRAKRAPSPVQRPASPINQRPRIGLGLGMGLRFRCTPIPGWNAIWED
jgi:hypothetical protein